MEEIIIKPASITFDKYEEYKNQAIELSNYIKNITVNEDTVTKAKKQLAEVRKIVKELNDRRISVKKELLVPYEVLESQVKEISGIIKEAEDIVANQVREIEEKARNEKETMIRELFFDRNYQYDNTILVENICDKFIKPKHLNKSTTLASIELEMLDFLEKVESEVQTILGMEDSQEILAEYNDTLNLAQAIEKVRIRKESIAKIKKKQTINQTAKEDCVCFIVTGKTNINFTRTFLQTNDIKYEEREY